MAEDLVAQPRGLSGLGLLPVVPAVRLPEGSDSGAGGGEIGLQDLTLGHPLQAVDVREEVVVERRSLLAPGDEVTLAGAVQAE